MSRHNLYSLYIIEFLIFTDTEYDFNEIWLEQSLIAEYFKIIRVHQFDISGVE